MRLSVVLFAVAAAGILGGGALIGVAALGACLIFESLCVGAWALLRDDGREPVLQRVPGSGGTLHDILERASVS